LIVDLGDVRTI
jgi:hypothetical protein